MEEKLAVGDVVHLKSDQNLMTINNIDEFHDWVSVQCVWFTNNGLYEFCAFDSHALVKVEL